MRKHGTIRHLITIATLSVVLAACCTGADEKEMAQQLIKASGVRGGLVVHLGCGDGKLTAALHVDDRYVVQGLDTAAAEVDAARQHIRDLGLHGPVSADRLVGQKLPYADNLVNLLVVPNADCRLPNGEVERVLAPRGVAMMPRTIELAPLNLPTLDTRHSTLDEGWLAFRKPVPDAIDEWTHYLYDAGGNAVAADRQVGPPKHLRWVCGPLWGRSHEFNPSLNAIVSAEGRMFYVLDEGMLGLTDLRFPARWVLMARDAFNGVELWKRPVPDWGWREWNTRGMWSAPLTLNRRVVTDGPRVFATLGYRAPVTILDAATGKELRTIPKTTGTDEMILCDGVLLLCVRDQLSVATEPTKNPKRRLNPHEWSIKSPGPAALVAVAAESGRELWRNPPRIAGILTLAADKGRVCFHGGERVVCLDLKTGKQQWAAEAPRAGGSRHSVGTLVMYDGVVLYTSAKGVKAFAAQDGKELWTGPKSGGPGITHPGDLFVANGLVWGGDAPGEHSRARTAVKREGRDLRTGQVKKTAVIPQLISPQHHFRCYRSKATDRYLMLTKRGIEFVDLDGKNHMRHDWLRATCHYGFLPCNGLLYVPSHHCFCYPGVKLTGFLALAAEEHRGATASARLEKGPAFGLPIRHSAIGNRHSPAWPTYRRDPLRSGYTKTTVPTTVKPLWETKLTGKVSPPVIADGKLYVAEVDAHRVTCLDTATGKTAWSFTAGGRVDSPPTVHEGLLLFGSHDGWLYCLRADDGRLCWRYRAAPADRRVVAYGQVASPWPVHGSVLVLDGVAYTAVGHSSFLDGGVRLCALDPKTGKLLHETTVDGPWPDVYKEQGRPFDMEGTKSDILVTDGNHIFLYQMAFDKQLKDVTGERASNLGNRKGGRHLVATSGFLDDTWYDRSFWTYSTQWPGFYYANAAPKTGQILVFDDTTTYALHVFTERLRLSPAFTPGKAGYELTADDNENDPVLTEKSVNREKGPGFSRTKPPKWTTHIPLRATGMVLAGDKLVMAGVPDVIPEDDPYAAFEGRKGVQLRVVSAKNGEKLGQQALTAMPVFDGLIAAGGKLYLSTQAGTVQCLGGEQREQ